METKRFDLSNRLYVLVLIVLIEIIVGCAIAIYIGFMGANNMQPRTITVSGEGKSYVAPDVAVAQLGLISEGVKSEEVVSANNDKMNNIIKELKALGIDEKDIQTSSYNLSPKYNYTDNKGSFIDGYTLTQNVTLKIRDFTKISQAIQKATSLGANSVSQLTFSVDNPDKAKNEAMKSAIEKAKTKANDMASSSGLKLGKLINVYEGSGVSSPVPMYATADKATGMGGGSAVSAPDIQTGQQEITVTMNLTYVVK
ncbi:MAG TPA: SIMPL domain-containing protein [Patescibacteria group bacterium]|nr:SIMPL domain-containing protein [Patescibacteria group bacterium]